MRYNKPFTTQQRQQATRVYRSLCAAFGTLRHKFRPRSRTQRQAARELRQAIEDFASTLRQPDDKVNVKRLDELHERATTLAVDYSSNYLD